MSIDLIIIASYLIITLGIGMYAGRNVCSIRDYAVGNKNYKTISIVATIAATAIGGGSTVGLAEKVFLYGIVYMIIFMGEPINNFLMAQFIVPRMARFQNMISVGDIMHSFYGNSGRLVTGFMGMFLCVGYIGAQLSALGWICHYFFNISAAEGIVISYGVIVIYSFFGGIQSIRATDVFQFAILIVAIPLICVFSLMHIGGIGTLVQSLPINHLAFFPTDESSIPYISLLIVFSIPFLNPAVTQRVLMAKNTAQIKLSFQISACIGVFLFFMAGLIGLIVFAINPGINPKIALPYIIEHVLPVGIKGFAITGIMAVIMSTSDSFLNAASICCVHDIIKPLSFEKINDKKELLLTKVATIVMAIVGMIIALKSKSIINIILASLDCWGPTVLFPLMAGIFGFKGSVRSFWAGLIGGLLTFLIWSFYLEPILILGPLLPSLLVNALCFSIVLFYDKNKNKLDHNLFSAFTTIDGSFFKKRKKNPILVCLNAIVNTINEFSLRRVSVYGAQYKLFGSFALVNYVIPYFMWKPSATGSYAAMLYLRIFAGLFCFILLVKDHWPAYLKQYLPMYWHLMLMYCLPFSTMFMVLYNHGSMWWLLNMVLAMFLLAMLVDWLSFIAILALGVITGCLFYICVIGDILLHINEATINWVIYMYTFSILIGVVFSRNKSKTEEAKMESMNALSATIAHEMRTPLLTMSMYAESISRYLPELCQAYEEAKEKMPTNHKLASSQVRSILQAMEGIKITTRNAFSIIDMLLIKLRSIPSAGSYSQNCSMFECVQSALQKYPLNDEERKCIDCTELNDFTFRGNQLLMEHVILNLLKNALYQIKKSGKGSIHIWTDKERDWNALHFKDTGCGIQSLILPLIFKRFFTQTKHGAGIGLFFCKRVIQSFDGMITCRSVDKEFTEFIITLPSPTLES